MHCEIQTSREPAARLQEDCTKTHLTIPAHMQGQMSSTTLIKLQVYVFAGPYQAPKA